MYIMQLTNYAVKKNFKISDLYVRVNNKDGLFKPGGHKPCKTFCGCKNLLSLDSLNTLDNTNKTYIKYLPRHLV